MKKPNFEQKYDEFSRKLIKIGEMHSFTDQMKESLKLPKFLEDIWNDGYRQGIKYGKNAIINIKKN